jgi:mannose-6-phosphate isomerase-like protein (cupin superfamily)
MLINEDDRRTLIEWISDEPFCMTKAVIIKTHSVIGNHYHREKNEKFLLLTGRAQRVIIGDIEQWNVAAPALFDVPKGAFHSFECEAGSILLGVADKPHDPEDEIKK